MPTYSDKLKSPKWQKKRLEILQRDNFACFNCGDTERTLHVHHENYIKGKEPWDYEDDYLTTVCDICHNNIYLLKSEFEKFAYSLIIQRDRDADVDHRISSRDFLNKILLGTHDSYGDSLNKNK